MRLEALDHLACPECRAALSLAEGTPEDDGHVLVGRLGCTSCGSVRDVTEGVPRLLPEGDHPDAEHARRTAERFAREWEQFDHAADYFERQLLGWIAPLRPEDFAGRTVLEAGCGKGRHSRLLAAWGASAVVALDLGAAVDVAFRVTRSLPNVHVVQGDLLRAPVRGDFDAGVSVGVLHHVPDPARGFAALTSRVRSGGRVAAWVYGREGNEWLLRTVDPIRRAVTSRLPHGVVSALSLLPAVAVRVVLPLYRDVDRARRLPYGAYLHAVSRFPLREIHHVVHDQLTPPISHYLPESEVRRWVAEHGLEQPRVERHNDNSWRVQGVVP